MQEDDGRCGGIDYYQVHTYARCIPCTVSIAAIVNEAYLMTLHTSYVVTPCENVFHAFKGTHHLVRSPIGATWAVWGSIPAPF